MASPLTASAFNQLGQYASSPGHRLTDPIPLCRTSHFFPSSGCDHK